MKQLNFAIVGAGDMARFMAETVNQMDHVRAYAVGSRSKDRAAAFAGKYGFDRAYGSYEELLADPAVDLVYIAVPHSHHAQLMNQCIDHKKPILCEKAFTVNAQQARQVLVRARENGIFTAEAIWPRYMPMADTLKEFISGGQIGQITGATANLAYPVYARERLHRLDLAGGALLDVGIYPLTFAAILFGSQVESVFSDAQITPDGVDAQNTIVLTYPGGIRVTLYSSIVNTSDRLGAIYGTEGYALVGNVNNFEYLDIYNKDHILTEHIQRPQQLTGYEYEIDACIAAMERGALECPQMPHSEIIRMMELMDRIREQWGLVYPCET